jgi:hypothetical protein
MSTQEVATRKPVGIIAKLASTYDMDPAAFETTLVGTIFPSGKARKEELAALCMIADRFGLDLIAREIYAFPNRGGGITPVISVDGWYKMANRAPTMDGLRFGYTYAASDTDRERPLSCVATLYRSDREHPVEVEEFHRECYRDTPPWNNQPHRMLRHRAAIQAIRVAFGIAALDPDEAERIPEYEVQAAKVAGDNPDAPPSRRPHDDARDAADLGEKYGGRVDKTTGEIEAPPDNEGEPMPEGRLTVVEEPLEEPLDTPEAVVPIPGDGRIPVEFRGEEPKRRRSRALAEQRRKFQSAMDRGWIDSGLISSDLPDTDEEIDGKRPADDTLQAAFAIMWSDDAEALLEKIKTGHYKTSPAEKTAPSQEEPREDPPREMEEPPPAGGEQAEFPV